MVSIHTTPDVQLNCWYQLLESRDHPLFQEMVSIHTLDCVVTLVVLKNNLLFHMMQLTIEFKGQPFILDHSIYTQVWLSS